MHPELQRRYRRLFRFYDVQGDGVLSLESDFQPVAIALAARWGKGPTPFPNLLDVLIGTYRHETERRDLDGNGEVDQQEFVDSHGPVIAAFQTMREKADTFVALAAGGFFDCLDLNEDGVLELADLEAYAAAYGKETSCIQANLARMLRAFNLPPDRLPRDIFLVLVKQYWFDPSPDVPGRWLFSFDSDGDS
jgi:hypothetical protein